MLLAIGVYLDLAKVFRVSTSSGGELGLDEERRSLTQHISMEREELERAKVRQILREKRLKMSARFLPKSFPTLVLEYPLQYT